ncbi:cytochrome P450 [Sporodiniella umbellata]|nr:cytochrome P450 [Sporodiniella umbellata]
MLALRSSPFKQLEKWHRETGPIYKIDVGDQLWVMIDDPYLAHDVFVKCGTVTSSRPYHRFITEMYSDNNRGVVFSQYSPLWRNSRTAIMNLLKPESVNKFYDRMSFETEDTVRRLSKIAESGEAFDPWEEVFLTSLNTVSAALYATRFESVHDPLFRAIRNSISDVIHYSDIAGDIGSYLPMFAFLEKFLNYDKKLNAVVKRRDEAYEKIVKVALESKEQSLVKRLYEMKEKGTLCEKDIYVMLSDISIAATETTANTLYWMFPILSQHPEVQERIIKELDDWRARNPSRDMPSFLDDRDDFPYTICVQKEVLRFRTPAAFGVPHYCTEDIVVNGYFIPKNTTLMGSSISMHSNPSIYEDPEVFRPERFMNNLQKLSVLANSKIEERDQFSFGWGRRMCPGIYLAEMEIFNFYVNFFSKLTVRTVDGISKEDCLDFKEEGVTIVPKNRKFIMIPRNQ